MKKKLPSLWVKKINNLIDLLSESDNFGEFLDFKIGKPERLKGYVERVYSIHITRNVRLIIELIDEQSIKLCEVIEVKGVNDYHGKKENWFIS